MPESSKPGSSWRSGTSLLWGAIVVAAIALGAYAREPAMAPPPGMAPGRMLPRVPGPPPDFRALLYLLGIGSVVWYAAALALPFLLWGARRIDPQRQGRLRVAALAIGTLAALVLVTALAQYVALYGDAPLRPSFADFLPTGIRQGLLPFLALSGLIAAVEGRRRSQGSALERERLRAKVAEQRLVALTGQLEPHFLFNTLQNISTLIHKNPEAADEMLAKLSDLLRDLLRHRDHVLVPLSDELRYARTYLEIAQVRFADRLEVEIDVAPMPSDPSVPLFILQPLIENALAHGIGVRARGGRISLKTWRLDERLFLEVADDGVGLTNGGAVDGIGLSNTRERLAASFGADQHFALEQGVHGGVVARIDIPYRPYVAGTGR
ncbi:MAG: histidine kinase [Gemmatimonadaceae bacterium]